jgi:hypothetical protein
MTVIKLDAATLAQFQAAEGQVVLADESGKAVRLCVLSPSPMAEPELSTEEWKRRMNPAGGMTTAQMLDYLKGLKTPA